MTMTDQLYFGWTDFWAYDSDEEERFSVWMTRQVLAGVVKMINGSFMSSISKLISLVTVIRFACVKKKNVEKRKTTIEYSGTVKFDGKLDYSFQYQKVVFYSRSK